VNLILSTGLSRTNLLDSKNSYLNFSMQDSTCTNHPNYHAWPHLHLTLFLTMRFAPFTVKPTVGESGPMIDERKRLIDCINQSDDASGFANLSTKRRRPYRAKKQVDKAFVVECDEEIWLPLEKKDLPIYYRDDTEGAPSTAPVLVGFYTLGGLVSEFDILDSAEINERGLMLRA